MENRLRLLIMLNVNDVNDFLIENNSFGVFFYNKMVIKDTCLCCFLHFGFISGILFINTFLIVRNFYESLLNEFVIQLYDQQCLRKGVPYTFI